MFPLIFLYPYPEVKFDKQFSFLLHLSALLESDFLSHSRTGWGTFSYVYKSFYDKNSECLFHDRFLMIFATHSLVLVYSSSLVSFE